MVEVRPNCLLTGHLRASVSSSGKDSALLLADRKSRGGPGSGTVCLVPRVSLWCACGPLSDHPFNPANQSLLCQELVLQINVFIQHEYRVRVTE